MSDVHGDDLGAEKKSGGLKLPALPKGILAARLRMRDLVKRLEREAKGAKARKNKVYAQKIGEILKLAKAESTRLNKAKTLDALDFGDPWESLAGDAEALGVDLDAALPESHNEWKWGLIGLAVGALIGRLSSKRRR